MRNFFIALIFILIATSINAASTPQDYKALINEYGVSQTIVMVAEEFNKNCPLVIDKNTSVISALPFSDRLKYQVSISDIPYEKLLQIAGPLKNNMETTGTNRMCTSEDSRTLLDAGIIMEYEYYHSDGRYLFSYGVQKANCLKRQ